MKQVNMNDDIKCNKNNTERKVSKNVWKTKMCYWTPDSVEEYRIELSDFQKRATSLTEFWKVSDDKPPGYFLNVYNYYTFKCDKLKFSNGLRYHLGYSYITSTYHTG